MRSGTVHKLQQFCMTTPCLHMPSCISWGACIVAITVKPPALDAEDNSNNNDSNSRRHLQQQGQRQQAEVLNDHIVMQQQT